MMSEEFKASLLIFKAKREKERRERINLVLKQIRISVKLSRYLHQKTRNMYIYLPYGEYSPLH